MRADINISVRKIGDKLGTRTEIKNVNSVKAVQQAINHEAVRQVEIWEKDEPVDASIGSCKNRRKPLMAG